MDRFVFRQLRPGRCLRRGLGRFLRSGGGEGLLLDPDADRFVALEVKTGIVGGDLRTQQLKLFVWVGAFERGGPEVFADGRVAATRISRTREKEGGTTD